MLNNLEMTNFVASLTLNRDSKTRSTTTGVTRHRVANAHNLGPGVYVGVRPSVAVFLPRPYFYVTVLRKI